MQKKHFSLSANPARVIAGSFLGVIITGTLLLMLPLSAKNGAVTNFFDALFTATSATCVTGLIVVDTYTHWTFFGQGVILSLIQIGGLGLVTLTLFFNLLIRRKLGLRTLQLAQESTSASNFEDTPRLLRGLVGISLTAAMCFWLFRRSSSSAVWDSWYCLICCITIKAKNSGCTAGWFSSPPPACFSSALWVLPRWSGITLPRWAISRSGKS